MTLNVVTVSPSTTLPSAYALMQEKGIRHLPVVDRKTLVGILSERDVLLRSDYDHGDAFVPDLLVSDVMQKEVVTCRPGSPLSDVTETILRLKIGCLPVVDAAGDLVGLITRTDLLRLLSTPHQDQCQRTIPLTFELSRFAGSGRSYRPWSD